MVEINLFFKGIFLLLLGVQVYEDFQEGFLYDSGSALLALGGLGQGFYWQRLEENFWGGCSALVLMLAIYGFSRGGMGLGDVFLAGGIGCWFSPALSVLVIFLAFMLGGIPAIFFMICGKGRKTAMPFGPFLAAGGIVAIFWGMEILEWYGGFFR